MRIFCIFLNSYQPAGWVRTKRNKLLPTSPYQAEVSWSVGSKEKIPKHKRSAYPPSFSFFGFHFPS